MSTSPVVALRTAMRARLLGDANFVATLGGARVFEEAPRGTDPPYVLFADALQRDWSADLSNGAEQFIVVSVISGKNGLSEALGIGQRLVDLLDEASLTLLGHRLIDLRFQSSETKRDQNGRLARVNLRFRATTEQL